MTDPMDNPGELSDEMAEFLQEFLDETEEQLDDLVETMLALERDASKPEDLNEAFRLIHSIKGSAGMMGFSNITALTHQLESRFELFRSGVAQLDKATMNVVLHSIDYLRQCTLLLRDGKQLGSPAELLEELAQIEAQAASDDIKEIDNEVGDESNEQRSTSASLPSAPDDASEEADPDDRLVRISVRFREGLQLTDLKAQLIVSRLAGLGEVRSTRPDLDQLADEDNLEEFEVDLETDADVASIRAALDVEGIEAIKLPALLCDMVEEDLAIEEASMSADPGPAKPVTVDAESIQREEVAVEKPSPIETPLSDVDRSESAPATSTAPDSTMSRPDNSAVEPASVTMRVDIDRLDSLLNLTGELVVTRARFVEVSRQISPALRQASMLNRIRDFSDDLRHTIEGMESLKEDSGEWSARIQQLRAGLELMEEQSAICDNGRQCFGRISEAIDQLSRVSDNLQRGVLETRMVPVGPLFNRFKRVVRDLSMERGKQVTLQIRGEKTELDKRMIDELGDPLVHLVRNSIDHGLESPDVRLSRGKSATGTICLEASQSGNSVYIHVRDDGGGIDVAKIKAKLVNRGMLSEAAATELTDEQALDYIWHPGFSTATAVTDVSGRGVGMDAVKTRIGQLNGTIEIDSTPARGTTFIIRVPLTLAIINSLLVRVRDVAFSVPIDDVREIVSVTERDIHAIHQRLTFDVRGEFLPLVGIEDIFNWHGVEYGRDQPRPTPSMASGNHPDAIDVVILRAGGKTMGLRVDELLGRQDVVIKSLAENFINIRGLSGAGILGDGNVCLMLDVGRVIELATGRAQAASAGEGLKP